MILTKDDLKAIGLIVDERIKPLEERMDRLEAKVDKLGEHVGNLEVKVDRLDERIGNLEVAVDKLDERVGNLEIGMKNVNRQLNRLNTSMKAANVRIGKLETVTRDIKLSVEERVIPSLFIIEAIYLSTSRRYNDETERLPKAYADIEDLKDVTKKHGKMIRIHDKALKDLRVH